MPGGLGNAHANKMLDHELGGPDFVRPATVYIALYTAEPTGAGGGTEAAGGGYARLPVLNNATNWPAAANQTKTNGSALEWSAFSADLGTIVAAAIFDAATAGNMLRWGPLSAPVTVLAGQGFVIPAGGAQFQYNPAST